MASGSNGGGKGKGGKKKPSAARIRGANGRTVSFDRVPGPF